MILIILLFPNQVSSNCKLPRSPLMTLFLPKFSLNDANTLDLKPFVNSNSAFEWTSTPESPISLLTFLILIFLLLISSNKELINKVNDDV